LLQQPLWLPRLLLLMPLPLLLLMLVSLPCPEGVRGVCV
jgi:hypothetical protein